MNKLGNIKHSTFNIQHPMDSRIVCFWEFGVGCSMLNVSRFKREALRYE
jgi:hypothetical protein